MCCPEKIVINLDNSQEVEAFWETVHLCFGVEVMHFKVGEQLQPLAHISIVDSQHMFIASTRYSTTGLLIHELWIPEHYLIGSGEVCIIS